MNNPAGGTPKSLKEAIRNGLKDESYFDIEHSVYIHVKDFMAQKFCISMNRNIQFQSQIKDLYDLITKEIL